MQIEIIRKHLKSLLPKEKYTEITTLCLSRRNNKYEIFKSILEKKDYISEMNDELCDMYQEDIVEYHKNINAKKSSPKKPSILSKFSNKQQLTWVK